MTPLNVLPFDDELARLERAEQNGSASVGKLEQLPKWLILIPIILHWLWLALKHRSLTLPAAANPSITMGGLVGEGKAEYFRIMGTHARALTAEFVLVENKGTTAWSCDHAEKRMREAGLDYPVILKPDIGWCGFGVRLVRNRAELTSYLEQFPRAGKIIVQRFITYEGEASLYFVRHPGLVRGRIVGIVLRSFPRVVGNGQRTIGELLAIHPRAKRLRANRYSEPCCNLSYVPGPGEIVRVSITGSTRVGGLYSDATRLVSPALEMAINAVANDMTEMHVARFDLRYQSLRALHEGTSFTIIEVNGAGSEAIQAWDPCHSLSHAFKIIFEKQRMIFSIGDAMRKRGERPPSIFALAKSYFRQAALIRCYPPSN